MDVSKNNIGTILISGAIGLLIGMGIMDLIQRNDTSSHPVLQADTTYNKVKLDSIQFKVGKHDTTIYNLKIKLAHDKEAAYRLNDSDVVNMFKELAVRTDSIK